MEKPKARPARRRRDRVGRSALTFALEQQSTTIANLQHRIIELEAAAARMNAEHARERLDMIAAHESAVDQTSRERLDALERKCRQLGDSYKESVDLRAFAERQLARVTVEFRRERSRNRQLAACVADLRATLDDMELDTAHVS